MGDANSSSLQSLISGSHTLRVWYDGPRHVRLAVLGQMGESDVVRNGRDLWVWSSSSKTASHRVLPDHAGPAGAPSAGEHARGPMREMTPQGAARMLLRKVDATTRVTTGPNTTVASRPAWQLLVTPRSGSTLVGSVRIAIDTATHLPLRVQVFPRGSAKPAFDVGYTSFDPTAPSSSVFRFNPPAGTKVTRQAGPLLGGLLGPGMRPGMHPEMGPGAGHAMKPGTFQRLHAHTMLPNAAQAPRVVGSGWDTVVVTRAPGGMSGQAGQLGAILKSLPEVHGSWGSGRLLQGSLFSVLLTDSGQVAAGAVPPSALYSALEGK
jgi:outer membrane lipoprotein-sorting protein